MTVPETVAPKDYKTWENAYTIKTLSLFVCAVLVLFRQTGCAMAEVGFNWSANTVTILFTNFMDLSIGIILLMWVGYGFMYPSGAEHLVWSEFDPVWRGRGSVEAGFGDDSHSADLLFQVGVAATAATIVSGAVAGRMKFLASLAYRVVLTVLTCPVSGMWNRRGGTLSDSGFCDFAGAVVVHPVGGFAGAIAPGPRIGGFSREGTSLPMSGHNMPTAALGVFILWSGWYGFHSVGQLTYSGDSHAELTTDIAVTTSFSSAAGAFVATMLLWKMFKELDLSMALNGALAGLVGITAHGNPATLMSAFFMGAVSVFLVVAGILALDKMKIDDRVGAFPVHAICGVWGGLVTGIFGFAIPKQSAASQFVYFVIQLQSTAVVCAWAFCMMLTRFMILKASGMLRVIEKEIQGLDRVEHGLPVPWFCFGRALQPMSG